MTNFMSGATVLPTDGSDSFMFPRMVWTNDHMHMYFNSLEESVKRDDEWNSIDDYLKHGIAPFLSNRGLRQRFQAMLPEWKRAKFKNFSRVHIDWKWEFLENAIDQLKPLLDDLFAESLGCTALQLLCYLFLISLI